jgi:hypothetical protein
MAEERKQSDPIPAVSRPRWKWKQPLVVPPAGAATLPPVQPTDGFQWQDALAIVGILLVFGGMSDMLITIRIGCFALSAIVLTVWTWIHKWPPWFKSVLSIVIFAFMGFVSWTAFAKSQERKSAPVIAWDDPALVNAGTKLSIRQLNANVLVQPELERRRSPLVSIPPCGRGFSRHQGLSIR